MPYDTLLFKLKKYGILGHSLKWFKSYLTDRSQALILNKSLTSFKNVTTGIPQGSIQGPVLFLIFMNDLPMFVKNCNLYADDTMLEAVGKTENEMLCSLQYQINKLSIWFKHNRLTVNVP